MHNNERYNTIEKTYDLTRKADPKIVTQLIQLLNTNISGNYLDIGCGTGNYTNALAEEGLVIEGIDISEEMLNKAKKKYPHLRFHKGNAAKMDFKEATLDGVTCILATHHINNNHELFQEVYRILKDKGHFVIFTATPKQMKTYWLCHYFPKIMAGSMGIMSEFEEISNALIEAGFEKIEQKNFFVTNELQDWFVHAGKYRPEIYLDPKVRDGISSFHLFSTENELKLGVSKLKDDLESGEIKKVISNYETDFGDYMFIFAEK